MIKTFITGIVIGIVATITVIHAVPAVDQYREDSLISVAPNGGISETFHINVPDDRIMVGASSDETSLPAGLLWPRSAGFDDVRAEVFKLRNARDVVVGVASRLAARDEESGTIIEWVLHLPARGSIFVTLDPTARDGRRVGDLRAGTREFEGMIGSVAERWLESRGATGEAGGLIELNATYVSTDFGDDAETDEDES